MTQSPRHSFGFVSLIGMPNAGKSTLMNALIGMKVAIVAGKPQTTRTIIQGVMTLPEAQVVFLDTPGIHEPKTLLHKRMIEKIREALEGRDLILFVAEATHPPSTADDEAIRWLRNTSTPAILVLNKIDLLENKADMLPVLEQYASRHEWVEMIPVSGLTGDGLEALRKAITGKLPEGAPAYPPDYITSHPERFLVAEQIREKILHLTREEVPHSVAVIIDTWAEEKRKDGSILTKILATIHVERDGQKSILIGRKGSMLKQIGMQARLEIEPLLDRKIYLELFVRVTPDWRMKSQFLHELDQSSAAGE
ncbi:MAG: GTPase Era [Bryobacteraceae bacterium]|nr:GTPase Era [Bryobacteraceae bacterium]